MDNVFKSIFSTFIYFEAKIIFDCIQLSRGKITFFVFFGVFNWYLIGIFFTVFPIETGGADLPLLALYLIIEIFTGDFFITHACL